MSVFSPYYGEASRGSLCRRVPAFYDLNLLASISIIVVWQTVTELHCLVLLLVVCMCSKMGFSRSITIMRAIIPQA